MRTATAVACLLLADVIVTGCKTPYQGRPIASVRVGTFRCADPVVAEAVRNVFIGTLSRASSARIVREGDAEVSLDGTVTMLVGGGSNTRVTVFNGTKQSSGGDWVSGVTVTAVRGGEILTSTMWSQAINGEGMQSPEFVAREAADRLVSELQAIGLPR